MSSGRRREATSCVGSKLVRTMAITELERRSVDEVGRSVGAECRPALEELLARVMEATGDLALRSEGSDGRCLLDQLLTFVRAQIRPEFARAGVSRESLLCALLQELAEPHEINQHLHGTCTVASVQYILSTSWPAEYARVVRELLVDGSSRMQNGDELQLVPDSVARDHSTERSDVERVVQSSLMQYAMPGYDYSNVDDRGYRRDEGAIGEQVISGLGVDAVHGIMLGAPRQDLCRVRTGGRAAPSPSLGLEADAAGATRVELCPHPGCPRDCTPSWCTACAAAGSTSAIRGGRGHALLVEAARRCLGLVVRPA